MVGVMVTLPELSIETEEAMFMSRLRTMGEVPTVRFGLKVIVPVKVCVAAKEDKGRNANMIKTTTAEVRVSIRTVLLNSPLSLVLVSQPLLDVLC